MVVFKTPTWIPGERGNGRPGIVAINKTYGKLKKIKGQLKFQWRCTKILPDKTQCPNAGHLFLAHNFPCGCCHDQFGQPGDECRKGPFKFSRWAEGKEAPGCECVNANRSIKENGRDAPVAVWARKRIKSLSKQGMKLRTAGFQVVNKGIKIEERGRIGKRKIMNAMYQQRAREKQKMPIIKKAQLEPMERNLDKAEAKLERRQRKRRRFIHETKQLKNSKDFDHLRRALRPMQKTTTLGLPKDQIKPQSGYVIYQTPQQRAILADSRATHISSDNLHPDAPSSISERCIGIEVKIEQLEKKKTRGVKRKREGEWFHCGGILCFSKDAATHREAYKHIFNKTKQENGEDALDSIMNLDTDFEQAIYVPLAEELNAQKRKLKSVKPAKTNLCSGHYAGNINKKNNSCGGTQFYSKLTGKYDSNYRRCIRELRTLFVMPPQLMENQAVQI